MAWIPLERGVAEGYADLGGATAFIMAVAKSVGETPGDWILIRS